MERLTLKEIESAVKGRLNDEAHGVLSVGAVGTDSRADLRGALFAAVKGEKSDGHDYIGAAFEAGAVCALSERSAVGLPTITVTDTRAALLDLAAWYRRRFRIPVICVTGSNGKTTTKDMIHAVLSARYDTLKTRGNFNNGLGVPLSVFNLSAEHERAVFELGMSGFGEIAELSRVTLPDTAVITNVGSAHSGNLGGIDGVFKAKTEILDYLSKDGKLVINGDDERLRTLSGRGGAVLFGVRDKADVHSDDIVLDGFDGVSFTVSAFGTRYRVRCRSHGYAGVSNALAAIAVGHLEGLNSDEITGGLAAFEPVGMRSAKSVNERGVTIVNDAYNASKESMAAAIDTLASYPGGKTALIAGDMLELGEFSADAHADVGRKAAESGLGLSIFIGEQSRFGYDAAVKAGGVAVWFPDKAAFNESGGRLVKDGWVVLVKASRGSGLEEIIPYI